MSTKKQRMSEVMGQLLQNLPIQFRGMALSLSRPYVEKMEEEQLDAFIVTIRKFADYIEGVEGDETGRN